MVVLTVIAFGLVVVLVLCVKRNRGKVQVSGQTNPFYMEGNYYINSLVVFIHNIVHVFMSLLKQSVSYY